MSIIEHDFGKAQRNAIRKFRQLLNLEESHEANIRANPLPYLERANERIFQLEKALAEASDAGHANQCTPPRWIRVDQFEYERLKQCLAIIDAARQDIDAHPSE